MTQVGITKKELLPQLYKNIVHKIDTQVEWKMDDVKYHIYLYVDLDVKDKITVILRGRE